MSSAAQPSSATPAPGSSTSGSPRESAAEARVSELDRVLDAQPVSSLLAPELFSVVDLLDAQPVLRRLFTDPSTPAQARRGIVANLLADKVSAPTATVCAEGAALRWRSGRDYLDALEREGVRAELRAALENGQLDTVEDELFHFERTINRERELAAALADRTRPVADRRGLVTQLLDGRAMEATVVLARRAVEGRTSTERELQSQLELVAELRARGIATVTVAEPLTDEQQERLRAALASAVGREVSLHVVVDPSVLGGVRVALGDEIIEGTVAGRLEQARRTFQ